MTNGTPEPLGIRVFSTMNSPGPFANVLLAGLLILLTNENFSARPRLRAVGYLSFLLLSLVRSAWIGWFLGLLSLLSALKTAIADAIIYHYYCDGIVRSAIDKLLSHLRKSLIRE